MLKNIFDSHSPKRLLNQIELLDQGKSEHQNIITKIIVDNLEALKDSPLSENINSIAILLNLLQNLKSTEKPNTAYIQNFGKRLLMLFSKVLSESNQQYFEKLVHEKNYAQLTLLGSLVENPDYANAIIRAVKDSESALHEVILHSHSETCIHLAIEAIKNINTLKQLEKELRTNNKKTLRLIQGKIEKIESYTKNKQLLMDKQKHLLNSISSLAAGSYFPLYPAKYQLLIEEWEHLQAQWNDFLNENQEFESLLFEKQENFEFNEADNLALYEKSLQNCLSTINEAQAEEKALQALGQNEQALNAGINTLITDLVAEEKDIEAFENVLSTIEAEYKKFLEYHPQDNKEKKQLFKEKLTFLREILNYKKNLKNQENTIASLLETSETLQSLLASEHKKKKASKETFAEISKGLNSIQSIVSTFPLKKYKEFASEDFPKSLLNIQEIHKTYNNLLQGSESQQQEFLERCNKKFGFLKAELNKKNLTQAQRLSREVGEIIEYCPVQQQEALRKRLLKQQEELKKIEDWYNYATLPKRKELCEAMEALGNSKQQLKIKHIQETIKSLQDQWKTLGQSKDAEAEALWQRFQEAGTKAYEPVQKFFTGKEQQKLDNLKKRENICLALETYLADQLSKAKSDINWPAAEHFLRMQNKAWALAIPIPQGHKNLEERFQQRCVEFENKLEIQRRINLGLKKELIQQAEKLINNEDSQQATEQAKSLQESWKKTGYCKEDNELWETFRKHCDKIFETRNELRQQHKQSEAHAIQEAKLLCQQLSMLASDNSSINSKDFESKINQLCSKFEEIKDIPKTRKDLQTQFYQAKKQAYKRVAELHAVSKIQHFQQLNSLYEKIALLEKGILDNQISNDLTTHLDKILEPLDISISEKNIVRKNIIQLKNLTEKGNNEAAGFIQKQSDLLRSYCIGLELDFNIDSPNEDRSKRMELQVLRLNKKFNQKDLELTPEEKLLQAYRLGGLYSYHDKSLIVRLQTITNKINTV